MITPGEKDGMTAPDLATRLRQIADCGYLAWESDSSTIRFAADLLTRHQAERETLRAQIEALRFNYAASDPNWRNGHAYDAAIVDVLALLAKGETP